MWSPALTLSDCRGSQSLILMARPRSLDGILVASCRLRLDCAQILFGVLAIRTLNQRALLVEANGVRYLAQAIVRPSQIEKSGGGHAAISPQVGQRHTNGSIGLAEPVLLHRRRTDYPVRARCQQRPLLRPFGAGQPFGLRLPI